jgi:hypothetical protein
MQLSTVKDGASREQKKRASYAEAQPVLASFRMQRYNFSLKKQIFRRKSPLDLGRLARPRTFSGIESTFLGIETTFSVRQVKYFPKLGNN